MSSLAVRTETKPSLSPTNGSEWNPWRTMRELLNWDPFRRLEPFTLMEEPSFVPRFEVLEDKDAYVFKADVPGIKENDINISVTGNRLIVSGKREAKQEKQGATYYICERSYGDFSRSFTLPDGVDVDHVKADLSDGVLSISTPKKPGAQTKHIPIQPGKQKS